MKNLPQAPFAFLATQSEVYRISALAGSIIYGARGSMRAPYPAAKRPGARLSP
ncbi:MAG: hypothetical protein HON51_09620 [Gammaproteobacteria bacterium]|jgi:hypothetical protein|nr:hypothetical protein [Gammaproteobacteria bacterium]MBT6421131.1 hypothetical protein [Gammaproteobacteria bacterium]MBT6576464.1 hypothetical protein [Gammaproteobacteria bacterium]